MSRRTRLKATAVAVVAVLLASACDTSRHRRPKAAAASTTTTVAPFSITPTREITIEPVVTTVEPNGHDVGSAATVTVGVHPSADRRLHVVFRETSVGGTAAQWQAAGWSAVAVAALVTGAPLAGREFDFDVTGRIDGLSAGALMTAAVIALIRGDVLAGNATITGTIEPDGSIGPVDNVAEKLAAVAAAHKTRMLIPIGQPEGTDAAGHPVDVVGRGRAGGVQVSAVGDIYAAYEQLTGKALTRLPSSTNTRLDRRTAEKIRGNVSSWLAKFAASTHDFAALAPEVQQDFGSYSAAAARDAQEAQTLSDAGADAGAFRAAVSAAALMNAIAQTGRLLPVLLTAGARPFVARVGANQAFPARLRALAGRLRAFEPASLSDADALVAASRDATDALSLMRFATVLFNPSGANEQQAINDVAEGAIYSFVAGTLVDAASDELGANRGNAGPVIASAPAVDAAAQLFGGAADANLSAFQSLVIVPRSVIAKSSLAVAERAFAAGDLDYALSQQGDRVLDALPSYFGDGRAKGFAALAGALALYARTAKLLATYDALGRIDPTTQQLAGIDNATAFNSMIAAAQAQLESSLGSLRSRGVSPVVVAADNELAGADRTGDAGDRFDALGEYWDGYLAGRVLSYLGGFSGP